MLKNRRLVGGQIEEGGATRGVMESRHVAGDRHMTPSEHPGTPFTRPRAAPLVPARAIATTPTGAGRDEPAVRRRRSRPSKIGESIKSSPFYSRSNGDMNRGRVLDEREARRLQSR